MIANLPAPLVALLNKAEAGWIPFAYAVPQRILRVSARADFIVFRVEQLVMTNKDRMKPEGTWKTLSTHQGAQPGAMLSDAMNALKKAQGDLTRRLQQKVGKFIQDNKTRIEQGIARQS